MKVIDSATKRYERSFNRNTKERCFNPGDKCLVRDLRNTTNNGKWKVEKLIGRERARVWSVQVDDQIWRRHENQSKHRQWVIEADEDKDVVVSSTTSWASSNTNDQKITHHQYRHPLPHSL